MNWISIKDRLPKFGREVLATDKDNAIQFGYFIKKQITENHPNGFSFSPICSYCWEIGAPTAWMPLPEPPKESK